MRSEFEAWVRARGGYIHPGIDLFNSGAAGSSGYRGVFATQPVAEGEQLLVVPVEATLHLALPAPGGSSDTVAATCSPALAAFLQQKKPQPAAEKKAKHKQPQQQQAADEPLFSPFIATALMLMAEMAAGPESAFAGYFASLPASTNCLIDWSEEDKKLLEGTSLQCDGRDVAAVFQEDILPRLQAPEAEGLFPPSCLTYDAFRRAVGLVQTRAFHMKADNWLTGASQECHDELYLIPGIDMLNHSTDPGRRNTSLALLRGEVSVALAGGGSKTFNDFFSMRAERDIPSGCEVLHTYGDLSDAQLLQTYGFIDLPPQPTPTAAAAAAARGGNSGDGQQAQQEAPARLAGNPHNYVALRLSDVVEAARAVGRMVGLPTTGKKLMDLKLKRLAAAGLLQEDEPAATRLLVSAESPLPDQLLTIVQVLMLSAREFEQLQQEQPQGGSSAELSLGQELLCGEFGELCGSLLVQAVGTSLKRYPADAAANAAVLQAADAGSCAWLAAAVALGEQQLLMRLKKAALQILVAAAEGEDDDDDSDEDESDEDEETDSDEPAPLPLKKGRKATKAAGASSRQAAAAAAAAAASASHKKRKQADSGKGAAAAKQRPAEPKKQKAACKPGSTDKAAHGKAHARHDRKAKAKQQEKEQQQKQGKRAQYGSMTGPLEEDVWQSDDSDKVGYSSPSEPESEPEPPAPADQQGGAAAGAAAAAGGSRSKRRQQQQQQQQAADEPKRRARDVGRSRSRRGIGSAAGGGGGEALHTYEVGASGHVREAHGHMLGPDEADLIASDDSDKVGYA